MFYILICILVVFDQLTKYLTVEFLRPIDGSTQGAEAIDFIPGFIGLRYAENTGAAFSILEGQIWFFAIITLLTLAFIIYMYHSKKVKHISGVTALVLIAGGAIGNLIDRLLNGFVVDMFEFQFITFAIFNVADIFITIGGVFVVYYVLFQYDKDNPSKKVENEDKDE